MPMSTARPAGGAGASPEPAGSREEA